MHPRKHAAHALDRFMSPLRLGSITLAGEEHLYSDMSLTFSDWMHFYFSEFAQGADPNRVQDADVLLGLMRDEDITQYEDQLLGMEGIHGIEDLYLQAGLYDVVQKLTNWGAIRDEEISHVFPPGLRELPQNKRTCITRGAKLELCMQFMKFGLIGTSPAMVRMYAYVDRKCCLARESPSSLLPNLVIYGEPGTEKEFLRNAICKLSGWPEGLLLVARSAPEDLSGSVGIPCLRDRAMDIPLLVNHYLQHELRESDLDSLRFPLARACWWRTLASSMCRS